MGLDRRDRWTWRQLDDRRSDHAGRCPGALSAAVRKGEPERMLDSFLVSGLIEARSHERMALLAEHSPEPDLQDLYGSLLLSEARHFGLYWVLCEQRWERSVIVPRLEELAQVEVEALTGFLENPEDVRMHSVGVESR